MKIILISLLCGSVSTGILIATNYESYLQAHNAYTQKEYSQSISLLNQLPHDNFPVLYNLGWSYLKNNELYAALHSFKKALLYCSGKNHMRTDKLCRQIQNDMGAKFSESKFYYWHTLFNAHVPTIIIQLLFLIFFLLSGFLWLTSYYKKKRWLMLCVLFLSCVTSIIVYDRFRSESRIPILIKNNTSFLYSGPDDWYTTVCRTKSGSNGQILSCDGEWYCITCDGYTGWIKATDVDVIQ